MRRLRATASNPGLRQSDGYQRASCLSCVPSEPCVGECAHAVSHWTRDQTGGPMTVASLGSNRSHDGGEGRGHGRVDRCCAVSSSAPVAQCRGVLDFEVARATGAACGGDLRSPVYSGSRAVVTAGQITLSGRRVGQAPSGITAQVVRVQQIVGHQPWLHERQ